MRRILSLVLVAAIGVAVWFSLKSDPIEADEIVASGSGTHDARESAPAIADEPTGLREAAPVEIAKRDGPPASFLAALGAITGRVVDADKKPMPDFSVALVGGQFETFIPSQTSWLEDPDLDFTYARLETRTADDGRFRIERVDPGAYYLFHLGGGTDREKIDVCAAQPAPGATVDVGDLVLDRFATLTGRVVNAKGEPLAGARVRATPMPAEFFTFGIHRAVRGSAIAFKEPGAGTWRVFDLPPVVFRVLDLMPYRETTSGEDGAYRIEGVPLGMITVAADKESFLLNVRGPVNTQDGGERTVGDIKLAVAETLTGRVIDGSDEGVADARVLAGPVLSIFPVALIAPIEPTDSKGAFTATGFTDESHVVAARRKDACIYKVADDVVPGIDEPEIRLDETTTLTVRVIGPDEKLASDARIIVKPKSEISEVPLLQPPLQTASRTTRKDDGTIEVAGLSRTKYHVYAKKDGFALGKGEADLENGPGSAEIRLVEETVGTVRVVAKATGAPIEHALVLALDSEDEGGDPSPIPIAPLAAVRTDENGFAALKGLDAGRNFVRVLHPAWSQVDAEITAPGPALIVELTGGGTLKGRIKKDGQPIAESHVVIAFREDEEFKVLPRATLASGTTGNFEFSRLPEGTYFVQAGKTLEDMMTRMIGGAQSGMGAGSPLSAGLFQAFSLRGAREHEAEAEAERANDEQKEAAEARKRDRGGDGGGVSVNVKVGNGGSRSPRDSGSPPAPPIDVDPGYRAVVREGQDTWLEIDLARLPGDFPKARLDGVVLVNGVPTGGLLVTADHQGGGPVKAERTNDAGRFDLGEVPAGDLRVRVSKGRGDVISDLLVSKLTLDPNDTRTLDLRVEAGYVDGAVRAAGDGRFISEASVRLVPLKEKDEPDFEGCYLLESTGSDGRFHFAVVPQGRYKLEVTREGFSAGAADPFDVANRGAPPAIEVRLVAAVRVAGSIELPPDAGKFEMLFVHFPSAAMLDFSGLVFVDPKTMKFEVKGVAPGDYDVNIYGTHREVEPVKLHVPFNGLSDCTLRPQWKAPKAPEPVLTPVEDK